MKQRYTKKELDEMRQLKMQGASYYEIATIFNRSVRAIQQKFCELGWTKDGKPAATQPETVNSKWFKEHVHSHPSWKPSEEQMTALQCAIVFMEIRKASDYDISPLKSLYEQLKKL